MIKRECKDVIVYVCHNCMPDNEDFSRQWIQDNVHVQVKEVPCSGKISTQYIFHVLEGGASGIYVVACSKGDCRLSQGNYRAEIRIRNVKRLLSEIGANPNRVTIVNYAKDNGSLEKFIHNTIKKSSLIESAQVLVKK